VRADPELVVQIVLEQLDELRPAAPAGTGPPAQDEPAWRQGQKQLKGQP